MNELEFAVELAKKAGSIMKEKYGTHAELKSDGTLLTEADTQINQLVIDAVKKQFPSHGVLAEEGSEFDNEKFVWVCDPIDGTAPFRHKIPISTFSLALVEDGVPIVAVLNDPFSDRMFTAEKGKGAFLNGEPIHVNKNTGVVGVGINVSLGGPNGAGELSPVFDELHKRRAFPFRLNSVALSIALVASGNMTCALFSWISPWDVAAGKLLVEEAGGKTSDLFGNDQRYDRDTKGFVATNGLLHDEILKIIKEKMK